MGRLIFGFMGLDNRKFEGQNVNIFLSISFNICFGCCKELLIFLIILTYGVGAQKNRLHERVLLSNIWFG